MRRSKAIEKAVMNLELVKPHPCAACFGKGKWIFFQNTGPCQECHGSGILGATQEQIKQINDYIERDLDIDELLKYTLP